MINRDIRQVRWALGAIGALTLALVVLSVPASAPHNHWVAIAAVTGFVALLYAFLATWVAFMAYMRSRLKPELRFEVLNWGEAHGDGDTLSWRFEMTVINDGPVAARFIAVRITIDGARFSDDNRAWSLSADKRMMQYDGGADDIVHPHWREPMSPIYWQVLPVSPDADTFTAKIELVADRTGTVTEKQTVTIINPDPPTLTRTPVHTLDRGSG
jgi:hypothetical protein